MFKRVFLVVFLIFLLSFLGIVIYLYNSVPYKFQNLLGQTKINKAGWIVFKTPYERVFLTDIKNTSNNLLIHDPRVATLTQSDYYPDAVVDFPEPLYNGEHVITAKILPDKRNIAYLVRLEPEQEVRIKILSLDKLYVEKQIKVQNNYLIPDDLLVSDSGRYFAIRSEKNYSYFDSATLQQILTPPDSFFYRDEIASPLQSVSKNIATSEEQVEEENLDKESRPKKYLISETRLFISPDKKKAVQVFLSGDNQKTLTQLLLFTTGIFKQKIIFSSEDESMSIGDEILWSEDSSEILFTMSANNIEALYVLNSSGIFRPAKIREWSKDQQLVQWIQTEKSLPAEIKPKISIASDPRSYVTTGVKLLSSNSKIGNLCKYEYTLQNIDQPEMYSLTILFDQDDVKPSGVISPPGWHSDLEWRLHDTSQATNYYIMWQTGDWSRKQYGNYTVKKGYGVGGFGYVAPCTQKSRTFEVFDIKSGLTGGEILPN